MRVTPDNWDDVRRDSLISNDTGDSDDPSANANVPTSSFLDNIWELLAVNNDASKRRSGTRVFPLVVNLIDGCTKKDTWMEHLVKKIVKLQRELGKESCKNV